MGGGLGLRYILVVSNLGALVLGVFFVGFGILRILSVLVKVMGRLVLLGVVVGALRWFGLLVVLDVLRLVLLRVMGLVVLVMRVGLCFVLCVSLVVFLLVLGLLGVVNMFVLGVRGGVLGLGRGVL